MCFKSRDKRNLGYVERRLRVVVVCMALVASEVWCFTPVKAVPEREAAKPNNGVQTKKLNYCLIQSSSRVETLTTACQVD